MRLVQDLEKFIRPSGKSELFTGFRDVCESTEIGDPISLFGALGIQEQTAWHTPRPTFLEIESVSQGYYVFDYWIFS